MKKLIILSFVLSLLLPSLSLAKTRVESEGGNVYRIGSLFDVSSEFGYILKDRWVGRLRVGPTLVKTPWFVTIGTIVGFQTGSRPQFGVQTELMHSESGVWTQASAVLSTALKPDAFLSAGWSVVGYEYQIRSEAHVFKVKLPFSMIYYGLTKSW